VDLGTTWRWVVSYTPRPLYPQRRSPWYALDKGLGWPHNLSEPCEEKSHPYRDSNSDPSAVQPIGSRSPGSGCNSCDIALLWPIVTLMSEFLQWNWPRAGGNQGRHERSYSAYFISYRPDRFWGPRCLLSNWGVGGGLTTHPYVFIAQCLISREQGTNLVTISDCLASNGRMSNELERIWKETFFVYPYY
jgi:hypothetical protein